MQEPARPGRIIYLNGASSAGKTSIGQELQRILDEPYLLLGIDSFIRMMPARLFDCEDGIRFVPSDDGALTPVPGPAARRVFDAMYQAVAALCDAGNHVIFDDVMTYPNRRDALVTAWRDLDVLLVGVRCAVEVTEERERTRGDRRIGRARGTGAIAHEHFAYDLEVDSGSQTVADCARAIAEFARRRGASPGPAIRLAP